MALRTPDPDKPYLIKNFNNLKKSPWSFFFFKKKFRKKKKNF